MTEQSLRVNYLLEDTALFGGVKIPLHHANLLHRRGHEVRVISRGPCPDWYQIDAPFISVSEFKAELVPEADLNVATFWTTIAPAASLPSGQAVHYCQGFEASYTHNQDEHASILKAYSLQIPAFALSPHLAEIVRSRFGRAVRLVPPALERVWRPRLRFSPKNPPRVLVLHPFEIDWKGVETAIAAVNLMRQDGFDVHLVRISQWPLIDAERDLARPDEFHCRLNHREVARIMSGCDLLIAPSWEQEGFGLPVIEAMACGLPVVASRISAFVDSTSGAAKLVDPHDHRGFADAARRILSDRRTWRRMRRAGLEASRDFAAEPVTREVESAIQWAVSQQWRDAP